MVRGSRFIATLTRVRDPRAAEQFVEQVRSEFPDASHHCFAFVAGPPGSTTRIGLSDDGEPHGTAGRPILEALLHSGVGEVAAVVTRYFGGTKLGRGGLGRAYAGGVKLALETLPTVEKIDRVELRIEIAYGALDALFRWLDEHDGVRLQEAFGGAVTLRAAVPVREVAALERVVADLTGGAGRVERL